MIFNIPTREKNIFGLPKKKKFLFIPIPKTGTNFVNKTLAAYQVDKWIKRIPGYVGHPTRAGYSDLFRKLRRNINKYEMFTVARNPWDWHVSAYHYIKADTNAALTGLKLEHALFNKISFREYILSLKDSAAPVTPTCFYIQQQADWVLDPNCELTNITVLRQESLEQDLQKFLLGHGIDIPVSSIRPNSSEHDNYRAYYDDETRDVVAERHGRDIKFFGYSF